MNVPVEENPMGNSFTRVEYIYQRSEVNSFDTGIYPDLGLRWDLDANLGGHAAGIRWGACDWGSYMVYVVTSGNPKMIQLGVHSNDGVYGGLSTSIPPTNRFFASTDFPNRRWFVSGNGEEYEKAMPDSTPLPSPPGKDTIRLMNSYGGNYFYRSTIYSYGMIVQDLVPALDPQGVVCLYDLVTKRGIYDTGSQPGYRLSAGPAVWPQNI